MNRRKPIAIWGSILLLLTGVLILMGELQLISISLEMVPGIVMLAISVILHILFFTGGMRQPGYILGGGVMLVYGILMLTCGIVGWRWMNRLWPLWILGLALGLLEQKLFTRGQEGSWLTICILLVVSLVFLAQGFRAFSWKTLLGVILTAVGGIIVLNQLVFRGRRPTPPPPEEPAAGSDSSSPNP